MHFKHQQKDCCRQKLPKCKIKVFLNSMLAFVVFNREEIMKIMTNIIDIDKHDMKKKTTNDFLTSAYNIKSKYKFLIVSKL